MDWFPATLALGKAFCNRVNERKLVTQYIKHGRHVLMLAPRRYGKTSLINQVLLEMGVPFTAVELTLAVTCDDVQHLLLTHISDLLYSILPKTAKAKENILALFNWLRPEIRLGIGKQKLLFHPEFEKRREVDTIAELLKKLNDACALVNKRVVVVMDEFQQLSEIDNHTMEASIRHAMQYATHVSYIFSGSNRRMLEGMFCSKNRPFYNCCEIMHLDRISKDDYHNFFQIAARDRWSKSLSDDLIEEIFQITERHPNYINRLCGQFWITGEFPTKNRLHEYWLEFLDSKQAEYTKDILGLSKNQRKMLSFLAHHPTKNPSTHETCSRVGLAEASSRQAIKALVANDYIYKDAESMFRILDPGLKDFIKNLQN